MRWNIFATAILLGATASVPASADIITYTFRTTVASTSTVDVSGLFGPAGASLVGDPVTYVFRIDTSKGAPYTDPNTGTGLSVFTTYDLASLNVSASVTINGITFNSVPATDTVGSSGFARTQVGGQTTALSVGVGSSDSHCDHSLRPDDCSNRELVQPYDASSIGYFSYDELASFSYELPKDPLPNETDIFANISVSDASVTVETTTTPEPSSILLLGTGLIGAAGIVQRRRWRFRTRRA